jgi:hypothetical protein
LASVIVFSRLSCDPLRYEPFGIVTVIGAEIGLLTPPLGISCFAIESTIDDPGISLFDIFAGAIPFAVSCRWFWSRSSLARLSAWRCSEPGFFISRVRHPPGRR